MIDRLSDRRLALAAALLAFLVYNANLRILTDGDSIPARLLPLALWKTGGITLDPVAELATYVPPGKPYNVPYWSWRSPDGRLFSIYPVVTPVLIAPLYAPAAAALEWKGWEPWRVQKVAVVMEKAVASGIAAASAGLLYLLLRRRLDRHRALLLAAAYAFGTGTWTISSQALWQHGMSELLLTAALLAATAAPTWRSALLAGLACGLLAGNRPPDLLLAAPVLAYLVLRSPARGLLAAAVAAAALAPVLLYNNQVFGNVAGGYGAIGLAADHPFYHHPLLEGVAGVLASPGKGLLVFSPFLAFLLLRRRREPGDDGRLALCLVAGVACQIVLYAKADWRAGSCYGPRFLTDLLPALVWLLAPVVAWLRGGLLRVFASAVGVSVAIQAIGAFCYPGGRSDERMYPPGVSRQIIADTVWEWKNTPFLVEARAGLAAPQLLPGRLERFR